VLLRLRLSVLFVRTLEGLQLLRHEPVVFLEEIVLGLRRLQVQLELLDGRFFLRVKLLLEVEEELGSGLLGRRELEGSGLSTEVEGGLV